jgi:hypothetical protein
MEVVCGRHAPEYAEKPAKLARITEYLPTVITDEKPPGP